METNKERERLVIYFLKSCLGEIYKNDFELIERNVSERTLAFRLGHYLQSRIEELGTGFRISNKIGTMMNWMDEITAKAGLIQPF